MNSQPQPVSSDQAIRDLMWAVTSQPLLDDSSLWSADLSEGDIDGQLLAAFVNQRFAFPVGRYFEMLILYYLQHHRSADVLAHGQQIQAGGRTIGELDFVYRQQNGFVCHLETAVKFYLHFADEHPSGSHFIGPNPADNFETKLTRLLQHQLPLSRQYAPDVTKRFAFVKGIIFYHLNSKSAQNLPDGMAKDHNRGSWIRFSELEQLQAFKLGQNTTIRFQRKHKPFWLANSHLPNSHHELQSIHELKQTLATHFGTIGTPVMVSVLRATERDYFEEQQRLFIVDDRWPVAARS